MVEDEYEKIMSHDNIDARSHSFFEGPQIIKLSLEDKQFYYDRVLNGTLHPNKGVYENRQVHTVVCEIKIGPGYGVETGSDNRPEVEGLVA